MRRFAKTIGWLLGGVFALALIAYGVLFAANLEDRPPIAEIAVLESLHAGSSPVASDGNSYLYMLGFAGPPDTDPMSLGIERYQ